VKLDKTIMTRWIFGFTNFTLKESKESAELMSFYSIWWWWFNYIASHAFSHSVLLLFWCNIEKDMWPVNYWLLFCWELQLVHSIPACVKQKPRLKSSSRN